MTLPAEAEGARHAYHLLDQTGTGPHDEGSGSGGGGGFEASPAGVYVVKDGDALWRPAVDVNKIVVGGQLVAIVVALVLRSVLRRRS